MGAETLTNLGRQREKLASKRSNVESRLAVKKRCLKRASSFPADSIKRNIQKLNSQMINCFKTANDLYCRGKTKAASQESQRGKNLKRQLKEGQAAFDTSKRKIISLESDIKRTEAELAKIIAEYNEVDTVYRQLQSAKDKKRNKHPKYALSSVGK